MHFYAINGSPRKKNNTATLLQYALDGIESVHGNHTSIEIIHLHDLVYRGCISCFHCKLLGGKSYGKCIIRDDLTPVFEKLAAADGIIFGSPIYFGDITGSLRCCLERFLFQYCEYGKTLNSLAPKKVSTAFIYTMNVPEETMREWGYPERLSLLESYIGTIFTQPQVLYACNTYQFSDYSKYKSDYFPEPEKAAYRKEHFPQDCNNAFELGKNMALNAS